jgi:hypothetical protein
MDDFARRKRIAGRLPSADAVADDITAYFDHVEIVAALLQPTEHIERVQGGSPPDAMPGGRHWMTR